MSDGSARTEAARKYAEAYAAPYAEPDLAMALDLYKKLVASHATAREAIYSRTQVRNILDAVVPEQELLDAEVALALAHVGHQIPSDVGPIAVEPSNSERAQ